MKFKLQIKGTSPYCESGNDVELTAMSDLYLLSLHYGVPITLGFEPHVLVVDLEKRR